MTHTSKLLALLAVALVLPSNACNDPLRVSMPTIVPPGPLGDSAALGTLSAGAIGNFSSAYSGDHPDGSGGTGEGVIMYGGLLADEWIDSETFPTSQLVDTAIARFNAALGVAAAVSNATLRQTMTNLANVVKARALADSGDFAGAAATVSTVPTSFAYLSEPSEISTYENNGVFNGNTFDRRYSVADREGGNGFPFRRTDTLTNPIPTLPNLTAADDAAAGGAVNLLFNERARWLWLTAHRLGDLRRLIRQYGRAANTVFPTGPYFKSNPSAYGVDVNIPVPITEQNNPNFTACLNRLP